MKLTGSAASDYAESLEDQINEGAARNPYAAWEWGAALRSKGEYEESFQARKLAAEKFELIGDKPRSVISELDGAIDLAMLASQNSDKGAVSQARSALEIAIAKTPKIESRDVQLLQHIIAKEGEARIALASLLWETPGEKQAAEKELGECCIRLDQLDADDQGRLKDVKKAQTKGSLPGFSIDNSIMNAGEISCSRFKNEKFLNESLGWSDGLQAKAIKLQKLRK